MDFDRRSFLKALALGSTGLLQHSTLIGAPAAPNDEYMINVFLLGLFLMEFQGEDLILVTPKFGHHQFCILNPEDGTVGPMPEYVNLWDRLIPGSVTTFQPENLKFPATAVKSSGYVLDASNPTKHKHRCTMVLPKPYNIKIGKCEPVSNFTKYAAKGKIADYIESGSNGYLGSITCLQYKTRDNKSYRYPYGYFALHHPLTKGTVNAALRSVHNPCGQGFDLQMHDLPPRMGAAILKCPDSSQLKELFESHVVADTDTHKDVPFHVDVASCPQFGITG